MTDISSVGFWKQAGGKIVTVVDDSVLVLILKQPSIRVNHLAILQSSGVLIRCLSVGEAQVCTV